MRDKWKYKLDFRYFYNNDNMSVSEKAKKVIVTLQLFYERHKLIDEGELVYQLDDIISEFECVGNDVEQFDWCMDELYDWSDYEGVWMNYMIGQIMKVYGLIHNN